MRAAGPCALIARSDVRSSPSSNTVPNTRGMLMSNSWLAVPSTPSAHSRAVASALGPPALRRTGTSMGNCGMSPSKGTSASGRPSQVTVSPRSSPRMTLMYSRSHACFDGSRSPSTRRALLPAPIPTTSLPGAMASMVAMAEAFTAGCRVNGTSTPVPSPIRVVCSAIRASVTQTSP